MDTENKKNLILKAEKYINKIVPNIEEIDEDVEYDLFNDEKLLKLIDNYFLDRKEIDPAEIKSLTKNDILSSIIELHLEEKGQLKNKELDKINEPIKDNNLEDEVKVYLKEIGKIPLFTPEEEISFFERLEEIKLEIEEKPERKKDFEKIEKLKYIKRSQNTLSKKIK